MKITVVLLIFAICSIVYGQKYEYVYRNNSDSSFNCYLKVIPNSQSIKGLVIRDYSSLPSYDINSPYKFRDLCSENSLMTIYTVTSNKFPEFFISDSSMNLLDEIITEVVKKHNIPKQNIFIGGISASGTRALRFAQYCEQRKSKYNTEIKGVFTVDSPLDLSRFYESVHLHHTNFKEGMLWEANLMKNVFKELFPGNPKKYGEGFKKASVFSHKDSLSGNAKFLIKTSVLLFHEPDIDWWLYERGSTYFDINSFDIAAFTLKLLELGNKNIKLITTSNKGFDRNGNRNCHSWSIVDEKYLTKWIVDQID